MSYGRQVLTLWQSPSEETAVILVTTVRSWNLIFWVYLVDTWCQTSTLHFWFAS